MFSFDDCASDICAEKHLAEADVDSLVNCLISKLTKTLPSVAIDEPNVIQQFLTQQEYAFAQLLPENQKVCFDTFVQIKKDWENTKSIFECCKPDPDSRTFADYSAYKNTAQLRLLKKYEKRWSIFVTGSIQILDLNGKVLAKLRIKELISGLISTKVSICETPNLKELFMKKLRDNLESETKRNRDNQIATVRSDILKKIETAFSVKCVKLWEYESLQRNAEKFNTLKKIIAGENTDPYSDLDDLD